MRSAGRADYYLRSNGYMRRLLAKPDCIFSQDELSVLLTGEVSPSMKMQQIGNIVFVAIVQTPVWEGESCAAEDPAKRHLVSSHGKILKRQQEAS